MHRWISVAAAALAVTAVPAQAPKGSAPPAFAWKKVWNNGPETFDDLAGKVVLLDFSATWWGPCKAAVPHLNELHAKFAERGLLIIGVSDENESAIEDVFVNKLGAKYPIVKVDKNDVAGYGIKFFPSVYCIDPSGNVHSVPDDGKPSESTIEDLLKSVSLAPKMPEDSRYDALRSMWSKKDYGKVRDYLGKMLAQPNLDDEVRGVLQGQQEALDKKIETQRQRVAKLGEGPDYYAAEEQLDKIEKDWKGFDIAELAKQEQARFSADATIKKEIAAGKALAKLLDKYDRSKQSQAKKLTEELPKFAKKYEGTYAGQQAAKMSGGEGGG